MIGVLLAGVALLIRESRGLLIGEGIRPETARAIRALALAQPQVRDVGRVLSMYVGPDEALVTMDLDFDEARGCRRRAASRRSSGKCGTLSDDRAAVHRGRLGAGAGALDPAGRDAIVRPGEDEARGKHVSMLTSCGGRRASVARRSAAQETVGRPFPDGLPSVAG